MGVTVGIIVSAVAEGITIVGTLVGAGVGVDSAIRVGLPLQAARMKMRMRVGMDIFILRNYMSLRAADILCGGHNPMSKDGDVAISS